MTGDAPREPRAGVSSTRGRGACGRRGARRAPGGAASRRSVERLRAKGVEVVVESGAGLGALIPDEAYIAAGATIGDPWPADVVVEGRAADRRARSARMQPGRDADRLPGPAEPPEIVDALRAAGVQAFAMEAIPRISRAQSMDALSLAGQRGRLQGRAARRRTQSTRFFPMLTTAAGTVKPATVLVLGVGVAGLQALATAKRLGAPHHRLRRAARGGRPGALARRAVAGCRDRRGRRGRLRPRADRGRAGASSRSARRGDLRASTW